jgi:membrane protein implicated in regulation of membrane protease activity
MPWFAWLIAAAALGAAEFFTLTLAFGILAAAALVAAIVAGLGIGLVFELVAFAAAGAAGLMVVRPYALRQIVLEDVTADAGLVKVAGEEWSARTLDETHVIPKGATVDVMEIEGATAVVYPRELLP